MQIFKHIVLSTTWALISLTRLAFSEEGLFSESSSEVKGFQVQPMDTMWNVMEYLDHYLPLEELEEGEEVPLFHSKRAYYIEVLIDETGMTLKPCKKGGNARNYYKPVSPSEQKDIRYIVTTLAQNTLASITSSRSSLKKAGDRIDRVHPLRFLSVVFSDEELKAGIHAIRDRNGFGKIWDEFSSGLIGSLREEAAAQNLTVEIIQDFANTIGINVHLILAPIQESRWKDFINILIDSVPRANDPNRYNM